MSALPKSLLPNRMPGGLPPKRPQGTGGKNKMGLMKKKVYTPVSWDKYFHRKRSVVIGKSSFRVYECGSEGPVLLLLHGAGFSGLSWAVLSSVLSRFVKCQCTAIDLRGHGDTATENDLDLSADTLSSDIGHVVQELYGSNPPPIVLIGHSMGGAIAVHVAQRNLIPSLIGLVVIDVVEGTAMDALSGMQSLLRGRPVTFKSLEYAIEWCVRSGQVRNLESARVSMVGQLKRLDSNLSGAAALEQYGETSSSHPESNVIHEDDEMESTQTNDISHNTRDLSLEDSEFKNPSSTTLDTQYTWKIDLSKTDKYWPGWFQGLSQRFLSCEVPKMLLLAGVDRLDKDLTIGQMQGKFQMQVLSHCGHMVHEDTPEKVADVLATFLVRYRTAEPTADFQRTFPAC